MKVTLSNPTNTYSNSMINLLVGDQVFSVAAGIIYSQQAYNDGMGGDTKII
jgi:hypothetical protein